MSGTMRKAYKDGHARKSPAPSAAPALLGAALLLALAFPPAMAAQTNVLNSLNPNDLNAAIQAGGTVTFGLDGTIVLTNAITISNEVVLDGASHSITISGGGAVQILNILPSGQVTLRHLTLANGLDIGQFLYISIMLPAPAYGGAIYTLGNLDIENCTFTNNSAVSPGVFVYDGWFTYGGAIYNGGWLTISNTLFANNSALGGHGEAEHTETAGNGFGGAIYNGGGTLSLGNDTFSNNTATGGAAYSVINGAQAGAGGGGAIFSAGGVIAASNIQVINNTASGGSYSQPNQYYGPINGGSAFGGAICVSGGSIAITDSTFSNNSTIGASADGGSPGQSMGGCVFNAGSAIFSGCSFTGSTAHGAQGEDFTGLGSAPSPGTGGAIYNKGTMQIAGSTVSNSVAIGGEARGSLMDLSELAADGLGGGIYNTGALVITGTTLSGNNSAGGMAPEYAGNGWGGAIYNTGALQITGTTLSGNSSTGGYAPGYPGNAWGAAMANTGFVQLSSAVFSSNLTSGLGNFGVAIYSTGVIQPDPNSTLMPYVAGTPPLAYQWQLNGTNLAGATNSIFNLANVQFANAATYDLVISNTAGLVTNFQEILNLPPPPLAISSITPSVGLVGGGASVTITGTGFANGATVGFGNAAATSVTVVGATNITAITPAANAAGAVNVVVTNADFQPVVLTNGFTYEAAVSVSTAQQGGGNTGTFRVVVGGLGMAGCNFIIECSTNLVNWQPLQTNSSQFIYTDTNAANCPLHFYRGVLAQ